MKDIGVRLKVSGEGLENVSALTRELDKAGVSTAEFDAKAKALSAEFARLSQQQTLIDQFKRTKLAVDDADTSLKAAQNDAQSLGRELKATEAPTKAQAAAFDKAKAAVNAASQSYQDQVLRLQQLRTQLGAAGISSDDLAAAQVRVHAQLDAARKGVADFRGELQALAGQQQGLQSLERLAQATDLARLALVAADDAVEGFKRGIVNAAEPTRVEQQQLAKLTEAARQAQIAFQQQSGQQALASAALRTAGVSTDQLTAAQARGRSQAIASAAATDSASVSTRNMTAAQQAAEREIRQIQVALEQMAFNTRISGDEFDKAFVAGQARIAKLRAEIATVPPALDAGTRSANLLGEGIQRAGAFFSAFTVGKEFIDANVQLETMRRSLTLITGSTDKASQQIAFLRTTAEDAGIAVGGLAGPFAKFVASAGAAGISLETIDRTFAAVTKASGLLGLSSEDTAGSLLALSQSASKGKVSMEELSQQLGEHLPGVLAVTARGLGLTTAEMIKLIESGQLLADDSYFKAFAKGIEDTFVKGAGKVAGFRAELSQLKNELNQTFTDVGDAGGMKILTGSLTFARGALTALVTTSVGFATVLGQSTAAVVDFGKKLLTLDFPGVKRGADQSREALVDLGRQLVKTIPPDVAKNVPILGALMTLLALDTKRLADKSKELADTQKEGVAASAAAAGGHQENAKAQGAAASAAQDNATAQGAVGAAVQQGSAAAGEAANRWNRLNIDFSDLIDRAKAGADTNLKLADATKAAGDASLALAQVAGNEIHIREASSAAAEANARALQAVASAKESEANLTQIKIGALRQEAIDTGTLTDARKKDLAALELTLTGLRAESQGANEAADAAKNEALARTAATKTALDNSGALAELKRAYEQARNELALTVAAEKTGAATKDEVKDATRRLAAAEALYHDALDDTSSALARKTERQKQDLDVALATLNLEKAKLESQLALAKLDGNEALALDARIKLKQLEIQIIEAKIAATVAEAKATIAGAEASKAALEAEGKLTDAKKLEIEATIKSAQVKLLEAQAAGANIDVQKKQLENLQLYGTEAGKATNANRRLSDSIDGVTSAGRGASAQTILQRIELGQYITKAEAAILANTHLAGSFNSLADVGRNATVKSNQTPNTYDKKTGLALDDSGQPIVIGDQAKVGDGQFFDKAAYDAAVAQAFRAGNPRIIDPNKYVKPIPAPLVDNPQGVIDAERARVAAIIAANTSGGAVGQSPAPAPAPAPSPAPAVRTVSAPSSYGISPAAAAAATPYLINLNINGQAQAGSVQVVSTTDAKTIESWMLAIAQAKSAGGYP